MKKILGFRKFISKNGLPICAVYTVEEFSEYEEKNSSELKGQKVTPIMIFGDDGKVITDGCVGKELLGFFGFTKSGVSVQSPTVK